MRVLRRIFGWHLAVFCICLVTLNAYGLRDFYENWQNSNGTYAVNDNPSSSKWSSNVALTNFAVVSNWSEQAIQMNPAVWGSLVENTATFDASGFHEFGMRSGTDRHTIVWDIQNLTLDSATTVGCYVFQYVKASNTWTMFKESQGGISGITSLLTGSFTAADQNDIRIKVTQAGSTIELFIDGTSVGTKTDSSYTSGYLGQETIFSGTIRSEIYADNGTPSATNTPAATATSTFTYSPTRTFTYSPTRTFTYSPTLTFTYSPTRTFTASPTVTPSPTFTPTLTATPVTPRKPLQDGTATLAFAEPCATP